MSRRTVFPAAAEPAADERHPIWCACPSCTTELLEVVRRPVVTGGTRVDKALERRDGGR